MAAARATPRSSAGNWAFPRSWALGTGTSSIKTGEDVTVSCAEGDEGFVYRGRLPIRVERTNLADLPRPRTHMMMNVANPAEAFSLSFLPNDGWAWRAWSSSSGPRARAPDGAAAPRTDLRPEAETGA